jgi:hypothetical protein
LAQWFGKVWDPDFRKRHGRQLELLKTTLTDALETLRGNLERISLAQPTADFYRACRGHELRLLWVRALWSYFLPKFEQRVDSGLQRLLVAADEVVWACYAPAFEVVGRTPPPAPLPYVEPRFSARAIPLDEAPPELRSVDAEFLKAFLARLPIAVLGLPAACVSAPWWLAHAAHEVGHHVQHELGAVTAFEKALGDAARCGPDPLDEELAGRWMLWGEEIFADAYAFLCIGPSALRALADTELSAAALTKNLPRYPATIVRLDWQRRALDKWKIASESLGSAMDEKLHELAQSGQLPADTITAFRQTQRLAEAVLAQKLPVDGGQTLPDLTGWDAGPHKTGGDVGAYAGSLRKGAILGEAKNTVTIRQLAAAGVVAWAGTLELDDDATREQEQKQLAAALLENLILHAPPGDRLTRAATPDEAKNLGEELGALLLARTAAELEP